MPLESASWIPDLISTNPAGNDPVSQGDDHLRMLKEVLKKTFPSSGRPFAFPSARMVSSNTVQLNDTDNFALLRADTTGGDIVISLPLANNSPDGYMVAIQKASNLHTLFLNQSGSDTINGAALDLALVEEESWAWAWKLDSSSWNVLQGSAEGVLDGAVTNAKLADMADSRIKGRASGAGTGDPQDLSGSQAAEVLPVFSTVKGLVPGAAAADVSEGKVLGASAAWVAQAGAPQGIVVDEKAAGTAGGTLNAGTWTVRALQTVKRNIGSFMSVSSDEITVAAGSYYVEWDAPAYGAAGHVTLLRNDSDSSVLGLGSPGFSSAANPTQNWSSGQAAFTLGAAGQLRVEHRVETSAATTGGGRAANLTVAETYTKVRIWRV